MNHREKITELVKWTKLMKEGKTITDKLKSELLEEGINAMSSTKDKTIKFYGDDSNLVEVQRADKIDVISTTSLSTLLRDANDEFITKEIKYKVDTKLMNILAPLATGEYIQESLNDYIDKLTTEVKKRAVLKKKLKGTFKRDTNTLINVLEMSTENAETESYFIQEIVNYEKISTLLKSLGYDLTTPEKETKIFEEFKKCLVLDENVKISVKYEEE